MFRNYLKVSLKHLLAQRLYSAINVLGLAVGLTSPWVTVGGTAARAASAKPVLALRYE